MFPIKNILMWLFDTDLSCKKDAGKVEGRINLQFTKHLLETYIYYKTKCLKKQLQERKERQREFIMLSPPKKFTLAQVSHGAGKWLLPPWNTAQWRFLLNPFYSKNLVSKPFWTCFTKVLSVGRSVLPAGVHYTLVYLAEMISDCWTSCGISRSPAATHIATVTLNWLLRFDNKSFFDFMSFLLYIISSSNIRNGNIFSTPDPSQNVVILKSIMKL